MARPDDIRISYVVALIEQRCADWCAVDELARAARMRPFISPACSANRPAARPSFVRQARLRRACELVQATFLSIDPSHFSRAFKRASGSARGVREARRRDSVAARHA